MKTFRELILRLLEYLLSEESYEDDYNRNYSKYERYYRRKAL